MVARLVLAGAILSPAFVVAQPQASGGPTTEARKTYAIPAGALEDVLNRFAREAGALISVNAALVKGLQSPGLSGNYSVGAGLEQLLATHALRAQRNPEGIYVVQSAPPAPLLRSGGGTTASRPPAATTPAPPPASQGDAPVLPTVVVTATQDRKEQAYETPAAVSVITREDIDRTGPRHASEILQSTPGVFTTTNEQNPSVNVDIRGLKDFGRVNMSIDGMRQNYQRSGHQQRNGEMFLDTEFLSGVQIDKGATAGQGSLGTLGGVANFQTIEPEDVWLPGKTIGLRVRGATGVGGLANGQNFTGSAAFALRAGEDLDLLMATAGRRSGEYEPGRRGYAFNLNDQLNERVPLDLINQTQQDQDSALFKARWRPLPGHQLGFTALQTRLNYAESAQQNMYQEAYSRFVLCDPNRGVPLGPQLQAYCDNLLATPFDPESIYPESTVTRSESTSLGLDYHYKPVGNPWIDFSSKVYFVRTNSHSVHTAETATNFITQTDTLGAWATNRSVVTLSDAWTLDWRYGAEVFLDRNRPDTRSSLPGYDEATLDFLSGATPTGRRVMAGGHSKFGLLYRDWLEVTPGLRYDWYRLWGKTGFNAVDANNGYQPLTQYRNIRVDHSGGKWLPSLDVAIKPVDQVQFFANAGQGWRPPAITEALISSYTPGHSIPVVYYPNYLLEPEETTSFEIGANLRFDNLLSRGDRLRVKASAFRSETDNYTFFANGVSLPGNAGSLFTSMFTNSLDPVIFKGLEFDAGYDAGGWFAGLNLTQIEREATFRRRHFPLGGATGPNADALNQSDIQSSSLLLYVPRPPKYNGRFTGGVRLLERKLELSATLRCASRGGRPFFLEYTRPDGVTQENHQQAQNSFCVWDAQLAYRPSDRFTVGLTLKNVRDRQYAQAMGDAVVRTYAPGRTLTVFAEARF